MDSRASHTYLETQILTATPQKLQLTLIEGAIRFARKAREYLEHERWEEAFEASVSCRDILFALLSGIQPTGSDLNRQIINLYAYLYRTVIEASRSRDPRRFDDVLRVLEIERDTWRQLCEQMPERLVSSDESRLPQEITARDLPTIQSPHYGPPGAGSYASEAMNLHRDNTLSLDA